MTMNELLMKIKSSLIILIKDDPEQISKVQNHFLANQTLRINQDDRDKFELTRSSFQDFLERDERKIFQQKLEE